MSAPWRRDGDSAEDNQIAEFVLQSKVRHCTRPAHLVANHASLCWGHEPMVVRPDNSRLLRILFLACARGYTAISIRRCRLRRLAGGIAGCRWLCRCGALLSHGRRAWTRGGCNQTLQNSRHHIPSVLCASGPYPEYTLRVGKLYFARREYSLQEMHAQSRVDRTQRYTTHTLSSLWS